MVKIKQHICKTQIIYVNYVEYVIICHLRTCPLVPSWFVRAVRVFVWVRADTRASPDASSHAAGLVSVIHQF